MVAAEGLEEEEEEVGLEEEWEKEIQERNIGILLFVCSDEDYIIVVETSSFCMKVFWLE